ncbi:MAG TPA: hypothetical protein GXZ47_09765 [Treponema sp.]|nr:hypothetical protein [Treponema sp.]
MFLLITCTTLGIATIIFALIVHLSLPGWRFFSGLRAFPESRWDSIRIPQLRRRISLVFYGVAAAFLLGALLLAAKALSPTVIYLALPLVILAGIDGVWFLYRFYDSNTYSPEVKRATRVLFFLVNASFAVFYLVLLV